MPSQSFRHVASTHATRGRVWQALQDPEAWADMAGVDRVTAPHRDERGDLVAFQFEVTVAGRRHQGSATTSRSRPEELMVVDIDTRELGGRIEVQLDGEASATVVAVTLTAHSKGMMSSLAFPLVAGAIGSNLGTRVEGFVSQVA